MSMTGKQEYCLRAELIANFENVTGEKVPSVE